MKKFREEKKLTQQQLARMLEVSQSTISGIENGETPMSKNVSFRLKHLANSEVVLPKHKSGTGKSIKVAGNNKELLKVFAIAACAFFIGKNL